FHRDAFKSVQELIEAIEHYMKTNNQNPKPFVWTKRVDEILEKVSHCKASTVTAHGRCGWPKPGGRWPRPRLRRPTRPAKPSGRAGGKTFGTNPCAPTFLRSSLKFPTRSPREATRT